MRADVAAEKEPADARPSSCPSCHAWCHRSPPSILSLPLETSTADPSASPPLGEEHSFAPRFHWTFIGLALGSAGPLFLKGPTQGHPWGVTHGCLVFCLSGVMVNG